MSDIDFSNSPNAKELLESYSTTKKAIAINVLEEMMLSSGTNGTAFGHALIETDNPVNIPIGNLQGLTCNPVWGDIMCNPYMEESNEAKYVYAFDKWNRIHRDEEYIKYLVEDGNALAEGYYMLDEWYPFKKGSDNNQYIKIPLLKIQAHALMNKDE